MGSLPEEPIDERKWRAPEIAAEMNGIHNNSVLFYFARSSFFDLTSNNHATYTQAINNPRLLYTIQTRQHFEDALRKISGLEYVVLHDPSENDKKYPHSGIWVIRKQYRSKREGRADAVEPLATYYIIGDTVYQAAPLGAIVGSKLLTALTSLQKFLLTAKTLPSFTPAMGHIYSSPHTTKSSTLLPSSESQKAGSTPLPGSTPRPPPHAEGTPAPPAVAKSATHPSSFNASSHLFIEAWEQMHAYPSEYIDEYPLTGEPGNFRLSKEPKRPPREKFDISKQTTTGSTYQPFKDRKAASPPPIKTDLPVERGDGGGGGKERKGSSAKSPVTPGVGGKEKSGGKKRKKSMAAGAAAAVSTPKSADAGG